MKNRKLRMGMVGGGSDAFIGGFYGQSDRTGMRMFQRRP